MYIIHVGQQMIYTCMDSMVGVMGCPSSTLSTFHMAPIRQRCYQIGQIPQGELTDTLSSILV